MKKKIILTIVLGMLIPIIFTTKVNAQLQSRPGAAVLYSKTVNDFFIMARNMEQPNESFGLNAVINQANGEETSTPNGIDVHMIKNTEYGTAIMLGASSYGSIPTATAQQVKTNTITGNKTGVHMNYINTYIYTASYMTGGITTYVGKLVAASQRYRNNYATTNASYKPGDATTETTGWRSASQSAWVVSGHPVFIRGYSGVFVFNHYNGVAVGSYGSRVAVVCAPGI